MATSKIAITVPEDVLAQVDAIASERGETRSGFISRILRAALKARRDRDVTRRLDGVFGNEAVGAEQLRTAHEMDSSGTDWSGESWE